MYENVPAQSANENNEETQEKVDGNLIVAPTSSIISQHEVRGLGQLSRDDLTMQRLKLLQAMVGGISLTIQETTWNSLAWLVNEVGEIHSDNDEVGSETSGDDGEMTDSAEEAESMESTEV